MHRIYFLYILIVFFTKKKIIMIQNDADWFTYFKKFFLTLKDILIDFEQFLYNINDFLVMIKKLTMIQIVSEWFRSFKLFIITFNPMCKSSTNLKTL